MLAYPQAFRNDFEFPPADSKRRTGMSQIKKPDSGGKFCANENWLNATAYKITKKNRLENSAYDLGIVRARDLTGQPIRGIEDNFCR